MSKGFIPSFPSRWGGFTLIELIVVIVVLGILAAVALPRFVDFGQSARLAVVKSLAGTLAQAASNARMLCAAKAQSGCDINNPVQFVNLNGHGYWFNFGYPNAGVDIGGTGIDTWVNVSGFTPTLIPANFSTFFALDGSPTPSQCGVNYQIAWTAAAGPIITQNTSGC